MLQAPSSRLLIPTAGPPTHYALIPQDGHFPRHLRTVPTTESEGLVLIWVTGSSTVSAVQS